MKPHPGSSSIKSTIDYDGGEYEVEYFQTDSFSDLEQSQITQAYGVCFSKDKMLIVYNGKKNHWGLPGGTAEAGEGYVTTLTREVMEESGYGVLKSTPIGYQVVSGLGKNEIQLRFVCNVEKQSEFTHDPSGSITKIELINPKDYKRYFDWGEIGEAIIQRALELRGQL